MAQDLNYITVRRNDVVMRHCAACGTRTVHIGKTGQTCLQCTVDSGAVSDDLKKLNRWNDKDGKPLPHGANPRGYRVRAIV